ncbi:unnamed protein product (macronuclear) [Paramecium tetraurelia]|uniref:Transmembrane protein n=1 Tax=Paramecium tetraurelia TaxID=5888 RepID=A0D8N5_PARTE|nr:uncharacterized protein GSPATT00014348001 [Paramecium tetraurelia]CAK79402.1 unnamed protein product [Paramecium tetraurelia]|eukprot:XP_001446799.1 hypothetical protein (macronuclear) [Paramecium tetraurelia strain d4-2]
MAQQQRNETIVPILVTQEEYNEIMKQPDYMQQQLLQQLQQKKYEQQQQIYQHPYLQYQNYQQQQNNNKIETQSPIPSNPINNNPNQQQQQYYYTPQQLLLQQYNQNLNQNQVQKEIVILQHKEVEVAGEREVQFFNQNLAKYFSLELSISLLLNCVSALFRMKIINHYWHWSSELWVVIGLYILLNLFILTNPKLILQNNHQKFVYVIHVILYSLLLQGLQIAIQGYEYFFWNYFFFFYFMLTASLISVCYFIQQKGINLSLSTYLPAIIAPPSIIFLLQLICVQRFYLPLVLWGIVVVFLALGVILLFRRINKLGYNKHHTNDFYAVASILHMLMISPFYDNE